MGNRLKSYLAFMKSQTDQDLSADEKNRLLKDLLIQIGFFQHERMIHLIVTVTFALLTIASLFVSFFYQALGLYLLILLFLVLLIPYISHYYILENGVQKLYEYYDKLKNASIQTGQ
jgi:hypothetical protein